MIKRLLDGTSYHGRIGQMAYDEDRVQCHLCGQWFKVVGASHIRAKHGLSLDQYREMFHLLGNVTTAAPATSQRKRRTMLKQIASGERTQPWDREPDRIVIPSPPTVRGFRSLAVVRPDLAAQLHPSLNDRLDSRTLGPHSKRRVWWRCADCGHEWQQSPKARARGLGCPACGKRRSIAATIQRNRQPIARERSLAVRYPQLLTEWHPTRNGDLDPATIGAGSERKIWWRCSDCGHEWATAVNDRTRARPHGCPACARGRRRSGLSDLPHGANPD